MLSKNLQRLQSETAGASDHIHLNNAGASLMPDVVVEAVAQHLELERKLGGYEAAAVNSDKASRLYDALAAMLGCDSEEIAFADSGSRAWNAILYSISLQPGDAVVTTQAEFGSNVVSLVQHCRRTGADLRVVRCTSEGQLDLEDLERKFDEQVKLVAVTHVAAHRGYVAPVDDFARRADETGAFFMLDSAQAVGQFDLDVARLGCHALIGTGRKWLRGPRGTAFAFVSRDLPFPVEPSFCDLASADFVGGIDGPYELDFRSDARRFELWERSIASAIGLAMAVDYFLELGPAAVARRIGELGGYAARALTSRGIGARVLADSAQPIGTVGVGFEDAAVAANTKQRLADGGISVSTMADYDAPWDYAALGLSSVLRVAPHYFNTEEELDRLLDVLG
jgi:selenocysteine lyase/cysteine desulfurase